MAKTNKEIRELRQLFANLPQDKKTLLNKLIDRAVFMSTTLETLEVHINTNGVVEWFQNGSQEMWRESPALKSYNQTIKNYNATIKQLSDMLPESHVEEKDEMNEFLKKGRMLSVK